MARCASRRRWRLFFIIWLPSAATATLEMCIRDSICTNNQLAVAGNALNFNSVSELDGAALSDIEGAELYSASHNNGGILINGNILCIQDGRQGALEVNKVDVALISACLLYTSPPGIIVHRDREKSSKL